MTHAGGRDVSARDGEVPAHDRGRGVSARDVTVGAIAAALVGIVEIAIVGGGLSVAGVIAALMVALGVAVGAVMGVARSIADRASAGPWARAGIFAAGSVLVTVPVARHLFEGAFAATLPGAQYGHVWVPIVAYVGLMIVLRIATPWIDDAARGRATAIALFVFVVAIDLVNRRVQRTEYPDIHAFLLVVEVAALAIALRLSGVLHRRLAGARWVDAGVAAVSVVGLVAAVTQGLHNRDDRWAIATEGMHGRMLVRVVRLVLDADGDDHSPWLGGGDCDDDDPDVHPGAREIPGNDVDENCDGVVASGEVVAALENAQRERTETLEDWRATPPVAELLARTRAMNVLLFTVDALRADVVSDTPQHRAALPNTFLLFDEARVFDRAFAPSAGTDLSMSGLLTGRVDPFVPEAAPLFEAMGAGGYAVIPSEVIRYVGKAILTRGLTKWERLVNDRFERDVGSYTTSARTTERGLTLLDAHGGDAPWRLWLHYFDVHEHDEIKPSDKNLRRLNGDGPRPDRAQKYALLVRLIDEELGRVREALQARGEWDRTIVVLASDHGEGLGEDPRLPDNHGRFLYNALVHVPLAIRIPGVPAARIEAPVSLLDVYPTLLDLAGVPIGPCDGATLLPFLLDDAPAALTDAIRPVPLNETDQFGVIAWPHKLLVRREDNLAELYDLSADFAESHDRATSDPTRVTELLTLFAALPSVEIDRTRAGRKKREQALTGG